MSIVGSVANAVTALSFLLLSIGLMKIYRNSGSEEVLRISLGFLLLSISGVLGVLMFSERSLRAVASLYASTSTFALSGFIMILLATFKRERILSLTPLLGLLLSLDIFTGLLGLVVAYRSRSLAKIGLIAFSLSFIIRGVGIAWLGFGGGSAVLVVAEIIRSLSASFLAGYYVVEVFLSGEEKV